MNLFVCCIWIVGFGVGNANALYDLKSLMKENVPFRSDGKIAVPLSVKHVKLDIGLSYSAPMSQYWLTHENDLMVFGFEPNPESVDSILRGATKIHPLHGEPLDRKFIGSSFFLIPCALGNSIQNCINFYVTSDCGCSSIYLPKYPDIVRTITVPIFSLRSFFDLFPFDTHPVIDYIKIDTQGSDLDIVKSGREYIQNNVIYITLEAENNQYNGTNNSEPDIDRYMEGIGFVRYRCQQVSDPTYFNPRFTEYAKVNNVQIYQKG